MTNNKKVALITGGSQRIGKAITLALHQKNYRVIIHYCSNASAAKLLMNELNEVRKDSASIIQADLTQHKEIIGLARYAQTIWNRVDVVINNASLFFPTPIESINENDWQNLISCNLKAPVLLILQLKQSLAAHKGVAINICDIYAEKVLNKHLIYCISKAGLLHASRALAKELSPKIRVNSISPGAILLPEKPTQSTQKLIDDIPLKRLGAETNISDSVLFIINNDFINGENLKIDGGRTL